MGADCILTKQELLFICKRLEHCQRIEAEGMERIQVFTQAQMVADEVVRFQVTEYSR